MTKMEKLELLREWSVKTETADTLIEPVTECLGLSVESPIHQAVWTLQDAYTKAVSKLVGDDGEWLDWFAHENDFGRKKMEAGPTGNMRPIKDLEDLLWAMETQPTQWCYSTGEEDYHGPFDSAEAASMSAIESLEYSGHHDEGDEAHYWLAKVAPSKSFLHSDRVGDWIVDQLDQALGDEIPSDGEPLCQLDEGDQVALGEIVIDFINQKGGFKRFGVTDAARHTHFIGFKDGK
jgi:hypothetical protein